MCVCVGGGGGGVCMILGLGVGPLRSCEKVDVAVLGSLSLIGCTVSVDVKQHCIKGPNRSQELCESRGGRAGGLPVLNPFTAMLTSVSLGKRPVKVPNIKIIKPPPPPPFFPPSPPHEHVKGLLLKCTVLKVDFV